MTFYSTVVGSFLYIVVSYNFLACGYHVLHIQQAIFIAAYFKLKSAQVILKSLPFLFTLSFMFLTLPFLLFLCYVCVYPLIYCCNYMINPVCLLTFVLAKVLVYPLFFSCDPLSMRIFFFAIFLFIFFYFSSFFLKKTLTFPVMLV